MNIKPLERDTLSEKIMQKIAELIVQGELPPGSRLPSERELSDMFGVARASVREALRALALIGFVSIQPGRGTFVARREEQVSIASLPLQLTAVKENLAHVYHARRVVETELIVLASRNAAQEAINELRQKLELMHRSAKESDKTNYASAHDEFDEVVMRAAGNPVLYQIYKVLRTVSRESHLQILRLPEAMRNSNRRHENIAAAIASGDSEAARKAAQEHFDSVESLLSDL